MKNATAKSANARQRLIVGDVDVIGASSRSSVAGSDSAVFAGVLIETPTPPRTERSIRPFRFTLGGCL
jgi:hypothetical protein